MSDCIDCMINRFKRKEDVSLGVCVDKEKLLKTVKTEKQFGEWKKVWYNNIPECKDFRCCHGLMSCGIYIICGDCSIWRTFKQGLWDTVCIDVNCMDCVNRDKCKKTDEIREHPIKKGV